MIYNIVITVCSLFRFPWFFLGSLFCSRTASSIPYVQQSCLLALLLAITVSQTFLILMSLTILTTTGQIYHWMAFHWNLSDIILMIRLGGMGVWERKITEVKCHSHHIKGSTTNKIYDCWCWLWSSGWGFSPVKPLFAPFSIYIHWKKITRSCPCIISLRLESIYTDYVEFSAKRFASSPQFINLFNHLFVSL